MKALTLLALLAAPSIAAAQTADVQSVFDRATAKLAEGDHAGAAAGFEALAKSHPDARLAPEALFAAAELYEERLSSPVRAAALYRQLVSQYPSARSSLAAKRRLEMLERSLGDDDSGAAAVAAFVALKRDYNQIGHAKAEALARALIADHPAWPGRVDVRMWLARAMTRNGQLEGAAQQLEAVRAEFPGTEQAFDAGIQLSEVRTGQARYRDADKVLANLVVSDDNSRARAIEDAHDSVETAKLRARLYGISFAALAACLLALLALVVVRSGGANNAIAELLRPTTEILYLFPIALLLTAVSFTGHSSIGPAVAIICAVGVVVTWLSSTGLRAAADRTERIVREATVHMALSATAVAAGLYIALHRNHLLDLLISTVRFGPDV